MQNSNGKMFGILVLILLFLLLGLAVTAITAMTRVNALSRQLELLRQEVTGSSREPDSGTGPSDEWDVASGALQREPPPASPDPEPEQPPEPEAPPQPPQPELAQPVATQTYDAGIAGAGSDESIEEQLASRWLVWLGGLALALGGAFLVKFSIDMDLLGPKVRVTLGLLLAALLSVSGEWVRRRPVHRAIASVKPDYVPAALAAAGSFTAFGSLFAAYALYGLLTPLVAFALLAGVALATIALALLHGAFVAVLGVAGAFLVPVLVSTGQTDAWSLFPYLLFVAAAGVGIIRYVRWLPLAWITLGGAVGWPGLWFAAAWDPGDALPVGSYLLLLAAMFLFIRQVLPIAAETRADANHDRFWQEFRLDQAEMVALVAAVAVAITVFALVRIDSYSVTGLLVLAGLAALYLFVGWREPILDMLPLLASLLVILLFATWHLPQLISTEWQDMVFLGPWRGMEGDPTVPPEFRRFVLLGMGFGATFAGIGFAGVWRVPRPGLWAALSSVVPIVLFVIAYWRIKAFELDLSWASASLALGFLMLFAAERVSRRRTAPGMNAALGAYAVAVIACVALAVTMTLEKAWLTVAIAVLVAAIAQIDHHLDVRALRATALALALLVIVRLVLNYHVLDYPIETRFPGANWVLYGYGVPSAAFFYAARLFRRRDDNVLVSLLEAAGLAFLVLLLTLENRVLVAGRLDLPTYSLLEGSINTIVWLTLSYVLLRGPARDVLIWGGRVLLAMAIVNALLVQAVLKNPILTGDPVGSWPIMNVLLLAYALPAGVLVAYHLEALRQETKPISNIAGLAALALVFVWLNLEIRHGFHGSVLFPGVTTDAEWYAYSIGWLAYAGALLFLGIRFSSVPLRYASLAIVLLAVAKVFLFDMSNVTGLFRAFSFLGLGGALVGIGFFYQRYVFPPSKRGEKDREATA
ncbi:MAG: DUF2339 domain-containing protein [Alphaproteobacteria bacterium]|nr:DUF2339 domain-containing protein [Alphaproteobacteria bacterium]